MKSKKIKLTDIKKLYNHPSSVLFRSLELSTIYQLTKDITFKSPSVDIGCGGGFPCVPLAIFFPEVQFLAVDSIAKKLKVVDA